jgi:CBS domain containing-hemolysin-like protein
MGDGNDSISIKVSNNPDRSATGADLSSILLGNGDDVFNITSSLIGADRATVDGGAGNDTLNIESSLVSLKSSDISMGAGDDKVTLRETGGNSVSMDSSTINMGAGNDVLDMVRGNGSVDGGLGTDTLKLNKAVIGFQLAFTFVFGWLVWLLNRSGNAIVRSLGIEPKEELSSSRTAEELSSLVQRSASLGALQQRTADLITKTLELSQLTAADVMTPRTKLTALDASATVHDVIALSHNTGFSRFPVFTGSTDDVDGIVHVKAAASVPREKRNSVPATALMVEPFRVPETMSLEKLMGVLRSHGLQLAIVVDEYGGTAGIVTLEDLIEELVGELGDEHDRAKVEITGGKDQSYSFPGMYRPDELLEKLAVKVPEDGSYETVAGFLMARLGRVASVGDEVQIDSGLLIVERMDGRRVDRIRFVPDFKVEVEGSKDD